MIPSPSLSVKIQVMKKGKFAWGVKAKHCWAFSSKLSLANNLIFHWRWYDWIQAIFLNFFYFMSIFSFLITQFMNGAWDGFFSMPARSSNLAETARTGANKVAEFEHYQPPSANKNTHCELWFFFFLFNLINFNYLCPFHLIDKRLNTND